MHRCSSFSFTYFIVAIVKLRFTYILRTRKMLCTDSIRNVFRISESMFWDGIFLVFKEKEKEKCSVEYSYYISPKNALSCGELQSILAKKPFFHSTILILFELETVFLCSNSDAQWKLGMKNRPIQKMFQPNQKNEKKCKKNQIKMLIPKNDIHTN